MTSHVGSQIRPMAVTLLMLLLATPTLAGPGDQQPATATSKEPGRPRSLEIVVGGDLLTPQTLGSSTATLTSNNQSGTPFTYFVVDGRRGASPAFRGRLGYNVTSMFTVEGGVVIGRGNVEGAVSADSEGATTPAATDRLTQYFIDLSLLAHLRHMAFSSGAGVPFLEAGGGYLRQTHQDNLAINTGQIYHVGGGVTYMFSTRPASKVTGLGFRADARIYVPRKGYSFGGSQHVFAGLGGSLLMTF